MSLTHVFKAVLIGASYLALVGCMDEEIDARQAQNIQGLIYKLNDNEPFTGKINNVASKELGIAGSSSCNLEMENGLTHGEVNCYLSNGQLAAHIEYDSGLPNGVWESYYHKNGGLLSRRHFLKNQLHGKTENFNAVTGQLVSEIHYQYGKYEGTEKAWSQEDGSLLTDLTWSNGKKTGVETSKQGVNHWHEGKMHGLQTSVGYFEGQKRVLSEEEYQDGLKHGYSRYYDIFGNTGNEELYEHGVIQARTKRNLQEGKKLLEQHFVRNPAYNNSYDGYDALVPDGAERTWDQAGNLTKEVQWDKGVQLSGLWQEWWDGKRINILSGVPAGEGREQYLVKQGLERFYRNDSLIRIIEWNHGKAVAIAEAPTDILIGATHNSALKLVRPERIQLMSGGDVESYVSEDELRHMREDYLYWIQVPSMGETTLANAARVTLDLQDCISNYQRYLNQSSYGGPAKVDDFALEILKRECSQ